MDRIARLHKVGIVAVAVGLPSLLFAPFATVRHVRIVSGTPVSLFEALPAWAAALLIGMWLALAATSVIDHRRVGALIRGLIASAIVLASLSLSNLAAGAALSSAGQFARFSIGGGVWLSLFAAFTVIIASRREVGLESVAGWVLTLVAPFGIGALMLTGRLSRLGIAAEYRRVDDDFAIWVGNHILYSGVAIGIAISVGVALGVMAYRYPRVADTLFSATGLVQTIPGLAMVGLLAIPLALVSQTEFGRALRISTLGWAPLVIALTLYALLIIVRNTYAGLRAVPAATIEAGHGMGLTPRQVLRKVELPLAAPIVFSGVRTAAQQTIGNATLGYFVSAATLGRPIFEGVAQTADDLVLLGSVALVALALTADALLRIVQRTASPTRKRKGRAA